MTKQDTRLSRLLDRSIAPARVRTDGALTSPRTFGVYRLPIAHGSTKRFRVGNHPVRMRELLVEFGACDLLYLFLARSDACEAAEILNAPAG